MSNVATIVPPSNLRAIFNMTTYPSGNLYIAWDSPSIWYEYELSVTDVLTGVESFTQKLKGTSCLKAAIVSHPYRVSLRTHVHSGVSSWTPEVLIDTSVDVSALGEIYIEDDAYTGAVDGLNDTYVTSVEFKTGTTQVLLNGMRQKRGVDYNEVGNDSVVFVAPPEVESIVIIDFIIRCSSADYIEDDAYTGAVDGFNVTFTTSINFRAASTQVLLNGMRQKRGVDYNEVGVNQVVFVVAPEVDSIVIIDFIAL